MNNDKKQPGIAVKSIVTNTDGNILVVKRRPNDVHTAGDWEIPGGRLKPGEDPIEGVKRETLEETGLTVSVDTPLAVRHFTRDDGQVITMIIFACHTTKDTVRLSEEHTSCEWIKPEHLAARIHPGFAEAVRQFSALRTAKLL